MEPVNIGLSLLLVAIGAILAFAVNVTLVGIDITIVGVILMVVGSVGLALSLLVWSSFAPFARRAAVTDRTVIVEAPEVRDRS